MKFAINYLKKKIAVWKNANDSIPPDLRSGDLQAEIDSLKKLLVLAENASVSAKGPKKYRRRKYGKQTVIYTKESGAICTVPNDQAVLVLDALNQSEEKPVLEFEGKAKEVTEIGTAIAVWTDGVSLSSDMERHGAYELEEGAKYKVKLYKL